MLATFRGVLRVVPVAGLLAVALPATASGSTLESNPPASTGYSSSASPADIPPTWDLIGTTGFTYLGSGNYISTGYALSHGGEFHACVTTSWSGSADYALYEYDESNSDEKVGSTRTQIAGGCETWNVGAYVDGDNNRAELYLATNDPGSQKLVTFYD
ncbi:hypothetical protein IAG44_39295 [Streptomyces roseirectus]|uniref:Secreted protein n=1 Tax=Streptomyces roseirectus TaxID=2768066 RepID=A0A7H0IQ16_9ACTN|nr:hypothetical protein [Streptomyces roseirectus]QNP74882.1 hypothetical protein IAG44_39295 [Streptomyces roseirectus]